MRLPAHIAVDREAERSVWASTLLGDSYRGASCFGKASTILEVGKWGRGTFGLRLVQGCFESRGMPQSNTPSCVCFLFSLLHSPSHKQSVVIIYSSEQTESLPPPYTRGSASSLVPEASWHESTPSTHRHTLKYSMENPKSLFRGLRAAGRPGLLGCVPIG